MTRTVRRLTIALAAASLLSAGTATAASAAPASPVQHIVTVINGGEWCC
jgi:type IV secretory pathway VirB2 component (pilin)